jgi:hypothetical protein
MGILMGIFQLFPELVTQRLADEMLDAVGRGVEVVERQA